MDKDGARTQVKYREVGRPRSQAAVANWAGAAQRSVQPKTAGLSVVKPARPGKLQAGRRKLQKAQRRRGSESGPRSLRAPKPHTPPVRMTYGDSPELQRIDSVRGLSSIGFRSEAIRTQQTLRITNTTKQKPDMRLCASVHKNPGMLQRPTLTEAMRSERRGHAPDSATAEAARYTVRTVD
jgi:hypothetical protein